MTWSYRSPSPQHLGKHVAIHIPPTQDRPHPTPRLVLQQRRQPNRPRSLGHIVRVREVGPHRRLDLFLLHHHHPFQPLPPNGHSRRIRQPARHAIRNHRLRRSLHQLPCGQRQRIRRSPARNHPHHPRLQAQGVPRRDHPADPRTHPHRHIHQFNLRTPTHHLHTTRGH